MLLIPRLGWIDMKKVTFNERDMMLRVGFFVFVIALWHFSVTLLDISPLVFPAPWGVVVSLYQGIASGEFLFHTGVTLYETLMGFVIGAIVALVLGGLIGQIRLLEKIFYPYIVAFQAMPKVAVAPLFVAWFGFGVTSKIIITATIVFFPILANTIVGLRSAPREQIEMMAAFTASPWQKFLMVRFPHALPYIFAGLDVGIVLAIIGAIVGEFVGAQAGLGYLILQRNFSMDITGVFAILIVLSAIGIGLHTIMKFIAKRTVFWSETSEDLRQ
ncbi:ABC transporter permease [Halomonas urumqiensis]|uniref:ABC transporter permease n=2 Tax=Halomonas urumqiensis TaxID=1684789 RepID=A0A2N7UPZ2_9GAMM|nr:ABC transporter permease [Halomonas urumqiensis]PTB04011.1 ABC transporter permease [Halomonas urumqiensis]